MKLNELIMSLQSELNSKGERLDVDGDAGPLTQAALNKYDVLVKATLKPMPITAPPIKMPTPWMDYMLSHLGEHEIPGPVHNPLIVDMFKHTTYHATTDETPWCAAAVSTALEVSGYKSAHSAWAGAYDSYGTPSELKYGAILTIKNPDGSTAHVTFYAGVDAASGLIKCLGGNQADSIKVSLYNKAAIKSVRWPVKP